MGRVNGDLVSEHFFTHHLRHGNYVLWHCQAFHYLSQNFPRIVSEVQSAGNQIYWAWRHYHEIFNFGSNTGLVLSQADYRMTRWSLIFSSFFWFSLTIFITEDLLIYKMWTWLAELINACYILKYVISLKLGSNQKMKLNMDQGSHTQRPNCPVGGGCRIHWLLLCRGVRHTPNESMSVLDMILNHLMVWFQWCWGFGECGAPLRCYCSQVHSGL